MKLLAALAGVFIAMTASLPAHAQPLRRLQRLQQERPLPPQRGTADPRQGERGAGEPARPGQLSPEERRQLRRDIREHGREVYQERPRR